ncbi:unnamed protein product, partial [Sphenostylis stenocarpa]
GNRTRVCTVAGYYSTTRPLVPTSIYLIAEIYMLNEKGVIYEDERIIYFDAISIAKILQSQMLIRIDDFRYSLVAK